MWWLPVWNYSASIEDNHENVKQDRHCTYNVTLRRIHETILPWKTSITYFSVRARVGKCVWWEGAGGALTLLLVNARVALLILHAKRMRRIVLSSLAAPHFSTLAHKRHDFRGKKLLIIKCVFWFSLQLLFGTFTILRRIQRNIVINVKASSCKVPVILVGF